VLLVEELIFTHFYLFINFLMVRFNDIERWTSFFWLRTICTYLIVGKGLLHVSHLELDLVYLYSALYKVLLSRAPMLHIHVVYIYLANSWKSNWYICPIFQVFSKLSEGSRRESSVIGSEFDTVVELIIRQSMSVAHFSSEKYRDLIIKNCQRVSLGYNIRFIELLLILNVFLVPVYNLLYFS